MMNISYQNEIIVLFNGYSYSHSNDESIQIANCTCTLIKGDKTIIIDTMTPWDKDAILTELNKHSVSPENIDYVISTHGHSDHTGNNNLFLNAKHFTGQCLSYKNEYYSHNFEDKFKINDTIEVIATPGHTLSCVSVIVKNSNISPDGIVVVAGDLFENEHDIEDQNIWKNAGSENHKKQIENRWLISKIANYIIPGHGAMFKITDKLKDLLEKEYYK